MLRKYVMEASLLKALQAATPVVADVEMTAGGLYRFHAVLGIRKASPQHEGFQRNAILAAFAAIALTLTYPYRNDDRSHPAWALSPRRAARSGRSEFFDHVLSDRLRCADRTLAALD